MIMEQDEITRRNVAIAEYMDGKQEFTTYDAVLDEFRPMTLEDQRWHVRRYDLNWEHIMPVVEKIMEESRLAFHAFPKGSGNKNVCRFGMLLKNEVGSTMIEATWKAVSEYVLALK